MKKPVIAVAGSANVDVCLRLDRIPGAGESVLIKSQTVSPGGKGANRAVAAARLGAGALFSCRLGNDDYGRKMCARYQEEGISPDAVSLDDDVETGTAYVILEDDGANRIMVNAGANFAYGDGDIQKLGTFLPRCAALSLELEIPLAAVEKLIHEGNKAGVPVIVDAGPKRPDASLELIKGAYMISPNESEALALTGINPDTMESAEAACEKILSCGTKTVLLKMGSRGALYFDGKTFHHSPAVDAWPVVDTTAAGDTFMSAFILSMTRGEPVEYAMAYANLAAAFTVSRKGALESLPYAREVQKNLNLIGGGPAAKI